MKKLAVALFVAAVLCFIAVPNARAEGCFIDPETGIETCPSLCSTIQVVDHPFDGSCEFGHFENSCTGEVTGYYGFCA